MDFAWGSADRPNDAAADDEDVSSSDGDEGGDDDGFDDEDDDQNGGATIPASQPEPKAWAASESGWDFREEYKESESQVMEIEYPEQDEYPSRPRIARPKPPNHHSRSCRSHRG